MTYENLITALKEKTLLVWIDPDPIPGNDYRVTKVFQLSPESETCMIHYGGGSEAEVFISELEVVNDHIPGD